MKYTDVICINRYYAWYHDPGHLEIIQRQFESQLTKWYEAFKKPLLQAEYGADTIPGLHRVSFLHCIMIASSVHIVLTQYSIVPT